MHALHYRSGWMHDLVRPLRLLRRHIRYRTWTASSKVRIRQALRELFQLANRWLSTLGLPYWLNFGTLVGYHRERDIIHGDLDVDLAMWERDYPAVWAARDSVPRPLRLFNTTHRHLGPKLYLEYEGWEADIYFLRNEDGMARSLEKSLMINDTTPFPADWIEPLERVDFLGEKTWAPHRTLDFLTHTYGYLGADGKRDPRTGYWHPPKEEGKL